MPNEVLECDLIVVGAGMAGLSAAGWAAQQGASVVVVEKAPATGGSAAMSGGMLWTTTSPEVMAMHGGGRPELAAVVLEDYPAALAWLRALGIEMTEPMDVLSGRGYAIDIIGHLRTCEALVPESGGHIVVGTEVEALITDGQGRVTGIRTRHPDGDMDVMARATILATGGFQGSPEMRAAYIHENARTMRLRGSPWCRGDALALAGAIGAKAEVANPGFYGHLVSECPEWGDPALFTMLTQYHSDHCLLLNEAGQRFCDESFGDHSNSVHTIAQGNGRALCFWDERVQAEHATQPLVKIATPMDKIAFAISKGGAGMAGASLDEIAGFATRNGFDGTAVRASIEAYNLKARTRWETLSPPRSFNTAPLDRAPFYALVVYPAITCTHGGLAVNDGAQVLDPAGRAIEGLYAAGADAGDVFGAGYGGGLAQAIAFGLRAARSALAASPSPAPLISSAASKER